MVLSPPPQPGTWGAFSNTVPQSKGAADFGGEGWAHAVGHSVGVRIADQESSPGSGRGGSPSCASCW